MSKLGLNVVDNDVIDNNVFGKHLCQGCIVLGSHYLFPKCTEKWSVATQFLIKKFPMWNSPTGMESFWKYGINITNETETGRAGCLGQNWGTFLFLFLIPVSVSNPFEVLRLSQWIWKFPFPSTLTKTMGSDLHKSSMSGMEISKEKTGGPIFRRQL